MDTRVCKVCGIEKPFTAFPLHGKHTQTRRWQCQSCRNTRLVAWHKAHPGKYQVYSASWYAVHSAEVNTRRRAQYAENPTPIRAVNRAWIHANPAKNNERGKRRRAREANAPINDLTSAQFLEICQVFNFRCAYCPPTCKACKAKAHALQQDHVTALANGGNHTVHNVVPACLLCNAKKRTGPPPVSVQPLLLTLASPKKEKH